MKVDVITRHSVPNYGSLLQTYATQKAVERLGHEAQIINYTRYEERYENLATTLIMGKRWEKNVILKFIYKIIQTPNYKKMYERFEEYRKNLIKETAKEYGNLEELEKDLPKADVYCSGSDQIWGKIGTVAYDEAYFLEFAKHKKCISYASSFGKTDLSEVLQQNLNKLLSKYSKILVREKSAKDILLKNNINNVEQVVDPTLLLRQREWNELANECNKEKKFKYVLIYQLHNNKQFDEYAKKFAKNKKMKLLRISPSLYHITRNGKLIYLPTISEFLWYFKNADYILTDSFHATVFSIIFNKQFIDVLPLNKTGTRIESILELLGIQNKILKNYNDFNLIDNVIDYDNVNNRLENERNKSLDLLKKAIEE